MYRTDVKELAVIIAGPQVQNLTGCFCHTCHEAMRLLCRKLGLHRTSDKGREGNNRFEHLLNVALGATSLHFI
jgi:hypothetical protein